MTRPMTAPLRDQVAEALLKHQPFVPTTTKVGCDYCDSDAYWNAQDAVDVAHLSDADTSALEQREREVRAEGRREAYEDIARDLPWTYRQQVGLPDHAERLAAWVRRRSQEEP